MENNEEKKSSNIVFYGTFFIDNNEIAVDANYIQEVVHFPKKFIKLPLSPKYLIGVFNLRGSIISIVNLSELLKFNEEQKEKNQKIAIINKNNEKVGITIDDTGEIIRLRNKDKEVFNYPDKSQIKIINAAIKLNDGERIIQVLDPFDLFNQENIPKVKKDSNTDQLNENQVKIKNISIKKCISFLLGHAKLAFDITKIDEVVKVMEIEKTKFVSKQCIGIITLRDKKIPIIDFAKYLNINDKKEEKSNENTILILKKDENKFGLLIDNLESIISYNEENLKQISEFIIKDKNFYKGCLVREDQDDVLILEQDKLFIKEEVSEITEGYSKLYNHNESDNEKRRVRKINLYITFKISNLFAINLKNITEIINKPKQYITPPGSHEFIKGMVNIRGEMVAIIDTNKYYQIDKTSNTEDEKILIIHLNEKKVGLIIDNPESILHIDENDKTLLPNYIIKNSHNNFHEDVKEIIGVSKETDDSIIVLDVERMINRLISKKIIENK